MKEINVLNKNDLIKAIDALIDRNVPIVSNLANISKILFDTFENTSWCGFYLIDEKDSCLYLGPFQGPIACCRIPLNQGVCGKSAFSKSTLIVPDVHKFSGHIACSNDTNSEIVVPIMDDKKVYGVIDLDSNLLNNYTKIDAEILEKVAELICQMMKGN